MSTSGESNTEGKAMAHEEAIQTSAAERYVLGELDEETREAYEEHFFSCAECAEEVLAASELAEAVRVHGSAVERVAAAQPENEAKRWWFQWRDWLWSPALAYAAALLVLGLFSYQSLVTVPSMRREIAQAQQPVALLSYNLTTLGSRAVDEESIRPPSGLPYTLLVSIPPDMRAYSYEVIVKAADGSERLRVPVTAEQARYTVPVLVPPNALSSGRYRLVMNGLSESGQRTEIAGYDFIVQ